MPTYDYECDACGERFELFQSIKARPVRKCPHCGANRARRLIGTGGGVIFKGSGFYQTDYRSDSYRKAAEKDRPSSSSESAGEKKPSGDKKASEPKGESTEGKASGKGK